MLIFHLAQNNDEQKSKKKNWHSMMKNNIKMKQKEEKAVK